MQILLNVISVSIQIGNEIDGRTRSSNSGPMMIVLDTDQAHLLAMMNAGNFSAIKSGNCDKCIVNYFIYFEF